MTPNEIEAILIGPIAIGAMITSILSFIKKFVKPDITSDQIQLIKGVLTAGLYVLWMYITNNKENAGVIISILMVLNIFLSSSGVYDTRYWLKSRIKDADTIGSTPIVQGASEIQDSVSVGNLANTKNPEIVAEKEVTRIEGGTKYVPQREKGN